MTKLDSEKATFRDRYTFGTSSLYSYAIKWRQKKVRHLQDKNSKQKSSQRLRLKKFTAEPKTELKDKANLMQFTQIRILVHILSQSCLSSLLNLCAENRLEYCKFQFIVWGMITLNKSQCSEFSLKFITPRGLASVITYQSW